jgi:hypothetical protein
MTPAFPTAGYARRVRRSATQGQCLQPCQTVARTKHNNRSQPLQDNGRRPVPAPGNAAFTNDSPLFVSREPQAKTSQNADLSSPFARHILFVGAIALAAPAVARVAPAEAPATDPVASQRAVDQATAALHAEAPTGDVVVTGSRISSPSATAASPLQSVGITQIQQAGAINVQDVLLQNPVLGTPRREPHQIEFRYLGRRCRHDQPSKSW